MKTHNKGCLITSIILLILSVPLIIGFLVDFIIQKEVETLKKELGQRQIEIYRTPYLKDTQKTIYRENAFENYMMGTDAIDKHPESVDAYIYRGAYSRYMAIYDTNRLPGKYTFSSANLIKIAAISVENSKKLPEDSQAKILKNVLIMARDINNSARTYEGSVTGIIISTYALNELGKVSVKLSTEQSETLVSDLKTISISWYPPESSMMEELVTRGIKSMKYERKTPLWLLQKYLLPHKLFSSKYGKLKEYKGKENLYKTYKSGRLFKEEDYNMLSQYPEARRVILDYYELKARFAQIYTAVLVRNYYSKHNVIPEERIFNSLPDRDLYIDPFTGKFVDVYMDRDTIFIVVRNRGEIGILSFPAE